MVKVENGESSRVRQPISRESTVEREDVRRIDESVCYEGWHVCTWVSTSGSGGSLATKGMQCRGNPFPYVAGGGLGGAVKRVCMPKT